MGKRVFVAVIWVVLSACASGHCRGSKTEKRVKVYKADGSLQCEEKKPSNLESMAAELAGLKIYSQENTTLKDRAQIMLCGSPTGRVNMYEISESDLPKAKAKGFFLVE